MADSLTEAGRPHLLVEDRVTEAICSVYGIESEKSTDPYCRIDRVFHTVSDDGSLVPVALVEIKHRSITYADWHWRYSGQGYMISSDKISNGIQLSGEQGVPFYVIAVFDGNASTGPGVARIKVTVAKDGGVLVPFNRFITHKGMQNSVNGGFKVDPVDMLPEDRMEILPEVTKLYIENSQRPI